MNKNILICVSGLTPQIITETLFCLSVQKKIQIDELYVITTTRGRDVILGSDEFYNKREKDPYPPLQDEIKRMCEKHKKIKPPKFNPGHVKVASEISIELPDIRNDKDNKLFPNTVCEFINEKSKDRNSVLHCSISGGRKSMSVDMAFALSLFGRECDKLWHVLTHEDQEFKHFFPENREQEKELELAELPFVKLRSIIAEETKNNNFTKMSYTDLVEFTQKELRKKSADKLYISISRREMWYGHNEIIKIEPKQIELYRYFIENNSSFKNPIKLEALKNHFNTDKRTGEKIKGYDDTNIRQMISKINNQKIKTALNDTDLTELFIIHSGSYGTGEFYLNANASNVMFIE